ncbi:MAG: polyprenyl diphosphate synthase [Patescibacteria group bacterium]
MDSAGPRSIGVIMDGNRRWARARGLPTLEGHRAGAEKIFDLVSWAHAAGIEEVTVYAFSSENWQRAEEEVGYLMTLAEELFTRELPRFEEAGARLRFIGDRAQASARLQEAMDTAEKRTAEGAKGTIVFAFSYGGRPEILAGVNRLLLEGKTAVTEQGFKDALWSAGLLDPDLILRTGGEQRLSNFLTWQSAYSELFFVDTLWPDLSREEFDAVIETYAARDRRHGK